MIVIIKYIIESIVINPINAKNPTKYRAIQYIMLIDGLIPKVQNSQYKTRLEYLH